MKVAVMGDVMVDIVARHRGPLASASDTPAEVSLRPGGAARNVSAWLAETEAQANLVACVGSDALAAIALAGIEDGHVLRNPRLRTGACVVLVDPAGERTMLPDPGANLSVPEPPADLLAACDWLYVSGYALLRAQSRPAAIAALRSARAAGIRVAVDSASAAPLREAPRFLEWAGPLDLLLANEDELSALGDGGRDAARTVVVKRGAGGSSLLTGERELSAPARTATVVDTTGAGDAFAAGLLACWPHAGPERALESAAALAARAVSVTGAGPQPPRGS